MNTKNIWLFAGVLVAVVTAGFFLMRKPSPTPAPVTTGAPSQEIEGEESIEEDTEPVTEIEVSGKEFSFTPSAISVKRGDKVRVLFTNNGTMTHDFVVEELDVQTKIIGPGETDTIEFTVPDDGAAITFYCSVGAHRGLGMEGEFKVE